MKEEQYVQYIHNIIVTSLKQMDKATPSDTQFNKEIKNTISTLQAHQAFINNIAVYLKDWCYQELAQRNKPQSPENAQMILSTNAIYEYTKQYVQWLNQTKQQKNIRTR